MGLGHLVQADAELLRLTDESNAFDVHLRVAADATERLFWPLEQAMVLIEADRLDLGSRSALPARRS